MPNYGDTDFGIYHWDDPDKLWSPDLSAVTGAITWTIQNLSGTPALLDQPQAWGAGANFADDVFRVYDESDPTKIFSIELGSLGSPAAASLAFVNPADATFTFPSTSQTLCGLTATQTLSGKTLTTPTIASFTNATHDHSNAAGGGQLTASAFSSLAKATVSLTNQGADIGTTTLVSVAGIYLITANIACTTADAASGTETMLFSWTDGAGATTGGVSRTMTSLGRNATTSTTFAVHLASGNLTYAISNSGSYGSAKYAAYIRVLGPL